MLSIAHNDSFILSNKRKKSAPMQHIFHAMGILHRKRIKTMTIMDVLELLTANESTSLCTATDLIPRRRQLLITLQAISPLLAISTFVNFCNSREMQRGI